MSLTAGLWTSVSGLLAHGERMNVVGNNISNINTVGFKGSRMDFADFIYQDVGVNNGMGQVGCGVSVGTIMNDFSQGAFEQTTSTTDLAIGGNGFFMVKGKSQDTEYFTRAGNFVFDKDGYLVDPNGYVLQGWKVDNTARSLAATTGSTATKQSAIVGSGIPTDIRLDKFSCDPKHTNNATLALNLDSATGNDKAHSADNPFFALLENWDATPNPKGEVIPLGTQGFAHQSTLEVFDEGGQAHKLTVYFDRVNQTSETNIQGLKDSEIIWEYLVTMEPSHDLRNFTDDPNTPMNDKYKGLLMSGTMTFDSNGQMRDMVSYIPTSNDMGDLSTWELTPLSQNGYPMICPNFSGREEASNIWDTSTARPEVNKNTDGYLIEMNFGLRNTTTEWSPYTPTTIAEWSGTITTGGDADKFKIARDSNREPLYYQKQNNAQPSTWPTSGITTVWAPQTAIIPGEFEDTLTGLIYEQKKSKAGVNPGEAADANGWVFEQIQLTDTHPTAGALAGGSNTGSDGVTYLLDDTTKKYFEVPMNAADPGRTIAEMTAAGVTLTKDPNVAAPVGTNKPVQSIYPRYLVDSAGAPIQATTTQANVGMSINAELQNTSTTSYKGDGGNFFERFAGQDGYTYGELRYVTVSNTGIMSAAYSNGVSLELFQITLHDFPSKQNMRREGGNLFTETRESGLNTTGAATTGSFGSVQSKHLEQSNVDLSREFVNMITTQKGFQANSKSITTIDTMLDTVINMKR